MDQELVKILLTLKSTAQKLDIGNISTDLNLDTSIELNELKHCWEAIVRNDNKLDIYRIHGESIEFKYTDTLA